MEGYLQISDQLLDLCRGQCQRSGDVCIASRRSNLLHCRGGDICRVISVSVGWAHDSSPFVRMCRNLPKVSEWNILVHNFAGASVGTLILIVVGGGALVVAATISRGPSSTRSRATISVRYFLAPLCRSSQLEFWSLPSTYTLEPLATYSPTISARRCQATMLCHSVRSCHASFRSLNLSLVATLNLATGVPLCESDLRVFAHVPNEDYFVYAPWHCSPPVTRKWAESGLAAESEAMESVGCIRKVFQTRSRRGRSGEFQDRETSRYCRPG